MTAVVVVGSFNQDHVWSTEALPQPGATRMGRYDGGPGGKGFNQAVAAARAGAATRLIVAVGADATAEQLRQLAREEGIDLHDERHPEQATGAAGIFVDAQGRNVIVVAAGANRALSAGHVLDSLETLAAGDVLLAQLEVAPDAVVQALRRAREVGATALLNPAPVDAPTTPELIEAADILTPNETEFAALLDRHADLRVDPDALAASADAELHALCRRLGEATWVLTLGAHGAFVSHPATNRRGDQRDHYRVAAVPAQPVDTTGAGDAFSGALAAALATRPQAAFAQAIEFANRYAARSTEQAGAALAMPGLRVA